MCLHAQYYCCVYIGQLVTWNQRPSHIHNILLNVNAVMDTVEMTVTVCGLNGYNDST